VAINYFDVDGDGLRIVATCTTAKSTTLDFDLPTVLPPKKRSGRSAIGIATGKA
jgi:hypothetical protein